MDIAKYQELSGITVAAGDLAYVTATIARTQAILESLLGFTLTPADVNDNEYSEIGKTKSDCPDPDSVDPENLDPADPVVFAYRMYSYQHKDKILQVDPMSAVHKVKLVKDGVTFLTLDPDDYRVQYKKGFGKYIEICDSCYSCCVRSCPCTQLAIDATWLWNDEDNIPLDLMYIWADMVTFYSDPKNNVKSETLGSHSYTLFGSEAPESVAENSAVIVKYAGPNGSLYRSITL